MPLIVKPPHEYRLKTLAEENKSNEKNLVLVRQCQEAYESFRSKFMERFSRLDYVGMSSCLDDYRAYAKGLERKASIVGERTKYYSSILEEIPILLSRAHIEKLVSSLSLDSFSLLLGGEECVIRIAANPDGSFFNEKKRIDFCLAIDAVGDSSWIPLIGLEVKKYCDKTMFGTILETYKSLQIFRPRTYYGFLVEDEARGRDVVLNSPIYQREFILSGGKRNRSELNPVSPCILERFAKELLMAADDSLNVLAQAVSESAQKR